MLLTFYMSSIKTYERNSNFKSRLKHYKTLVYSCLPGGGSISDPTQDGGRGPTNACFSAHEEKTQRLMIGWLLTEGVEEDRTKHKHKEASMTVS